MSCGDLRSGALFRLAAVILANELTPGLTARERPARGLAYGFPVVSKQRK
jgi:hypothetical protein